jgi:hypothetical protein
LILLRKKQRERKDFFKIKYGKTIAVAGVVIVLWLLSSSRINELRDIAIVLGFGLFIYFLVEMGKRKIIPTSDT